MDPPPLFTRSDALMLVLAVLVGIAVGLLPLIAGCQSPTPSPTVAPFTYEPTLDAGERVELVEVMEP